jgi:thiol:disulfide interchange protein
MPLTAIFAIVVVGMLLWLINGIIPITGKIKTVVNVVLGLIVVGIALWLINTYIPMAGVIKVILNIVVVCATCVGVLQALGLWEPLVTMGNNFRRRHPTRRITHPQELPPTSDEKRETRNEQPVTSNQ